MPFPPTSPPTSHPYSIEIIPDNTELYFDKPGETAVINLTIIGYNVTGGTSVSFGYHVYAEYLNAPLLENPPDINLNFDPEQVVFPINVSETDTPYKLYSRC